jgi:hypothetical protein
MNENVSVIIIAKDEPLIYYTLKSLELQELLKDLKFNPSISGLE